MHRATRLLHSLRRPLALAVFAGMVGSAALASAATQAPAEPPELPPPVTITTAVLPPAQAGSAYSATLTTAGGSGCCTWTVAGGTLPAGLHLSSGGVLSGTPRTPNTYTFTVEATGTGPVITFPPMNEFKDFGPFPSLDGFFQYVLQTLNLVPAESAEQPQDESTEQPNNDHPVIHLNDAVTKLTLKVQPAVVIDTTKLPTGQIGVPYFTALSAQGGSSNEYTWSAVYGSLPPGLSLSPTGLLYGTPTQVVTANFTVAAADVATPNYPTTQPLQLKIVPAGLQVATYLLPDGTQTQSYSQQLQATGGTPPYTWSIVPGSGALPAGLTLDASTGVISGTPTGSGTSPFTVQVTDSGSTAAGANPAQQTATESLTLNINAATGMTIDVSGVPTTATEGQPYSGTVTVTGGTTPYTFSLGGGPPTGLTINSSTGAISGTPTEAGDFDMQITVTDSKGLTATGDVLLTVAQGAPVTITTTSLPAASVNTAYSYDLAASGGAQPYSWNSTCTVNQSATSSLGTCNNTTGLPVGMTLNSTTGALGGTPTAPGSYTLDVTVTDNSGATNSVNLTLTVNGTALSITTASLPDAVEGECYSNGGTCSSSGQASNPVQLQASGGVPSYTWSLVPCTSGQTTCFSATGLVIQTNGDISGIPVAGSAGKYQVTVQVQDSQGTSAQTTLTLVIQPPLKITTTSLPEGAGGTSYSQTLAATGGSGSDSWSVSAGTLPNGLTLSSGGTISGTLGQDQSGSTFTAKVTDKEGGSATQQLSINVLSVATASLPTAAPGSSYSTQLSALGGSGGYTWTCSGLPSGFSCSSGGTLTASVASNASSSNTTITVKVTDGNGVSSSRQLTLSIS